MLRLTLILFVIVFLSSTFATRLDCDPPFQPVLNLCIYVGVTAPTTHPGRSTNWPEARSLCQDQGGDLAILPNDRIFQAVSRHIDDKYSNVIDSSYIFWVGGRKIHNVWTWVDGTPINLQSDIWLLKEFPRPYPTKLLNSIAMIPSPFGRRHIQEFPGLSYVPGYLCQKKQ